MLEKLKAEIEKQTENEYKYSTVRACGEQILDIVGADSNIAKIILDDFDNGFSVKDCERKIKEWVDKNHKGNSGFCSPKKAEEIIREYFGIGEYLSVLAEPINSDKPKLLNLVDFL